MPELDTDTGQATENGEQGAPSPEGVLSAQERWIQEAEEEFSQPVSEEEPEATAEDAEEVEEEAAPVLTDWTSIIRQNPSRITEVPRRQRDEVWQRVQSDIAQEAAERARQETRAEVHQRFQMDAFVANVDEVRRNDPVRFDEWERSNPQESRAYYAHKAQMNTPPAPRNPYTEAAQELIQPLSQDIKEELIRRNSSGRYTEDRKGLAALQQDIHELTHQSSSRQKAAESRKSVPKADSTPPSQPKSKLSKKDVDSMSVEDLMKLSDEDLLSPLR